MVEAHDPRLESRWLAATLACAVFAIVAASLAIDESGLAGSAKLWGSTAYAAAAIVGFFLAPRLGPWLADERLQAVLITAMGLVPIFRIVGAERLTELGPPHLLLLEGMRNIVCVAAAFSAQRRQRRRCVLVGLVTVVFAFAFSGSLPVIAASLGYVLALVYWLACNDAERWSAGVASGSGGLKLVPATLVPTLAAVVCFATALLLYPSELGWSEPLVTGLPEQEGISAEEIRRRGIKREEDLGEIAERTIGANASGAAGEADTAAAEDDGPKFSTVRRPPASPMTESRQVFRVDGVSAAHLPAMTYDRFNGFEWSPELSAMGAFVSAQMAGDSPLRKEIERKAFALGNEALASGASAEDFLEQARGAVRDWVSGASGEALHAEFGKLSPLDTRLLQAGAPNSQPGELDYILTPYDMEGVAEDALLNPAVRDWLLKEIAKGDSDEEQVLARVVRRWRASKGGVGLPPELQALVNVWRRGQGRGYPEVDAVVRGLRGHCEFDPRATAPPGTKDTVKHFLLESRRGPDYLFASSAVVLMRAMGYPARMVSGFVARPDRYNAFNGQTGVYEDDLHYWAQVRVGPRIWVDVEPTPGFELRTEGPEPPGLFALAAQALTLDRPETQAALAGVGLLAATAAVFRRRTLAAQSWLGWRVARAIGSNERIVRATGRLIDRRAAVARRPRPRYATPGAWCERLVGGCEERAPAARAFRRLADRAAFHPERLAGFDRRTVAHAAERVVAACSVRAIRFDRSHAAVTPPSHAAPPPHAGPRRHPLPHPAHERDASC